MRKKSKRGKRTGLAGFVDAYNAKPTGAGYAGNTALKTLVDAAIGVPVGVLLGGAAGLWSLPIGVLLIAGGHHIKEQSGLVRIVGASAIAYGIAKNIDFKAAAKQAQVNGIGGLAGATQSMKERVQGVKSDLMAAYFLDRIFKKGDDDGTVAQKIAAFNMNDDDGVGAIDVSALDFFEDYNQQEADEFQQQQYGFEFNEPEALPYFGESDSVSPDAAFALIDDEPDLTDL